MYQSTLKTVLLTSALSLAAVSSVSAADEDHISFNMVVSKGASACLPNAQATGYIISDGSAEDMFLVATGLPPNTGFDFFVIQVPNHRLGCLGIRETSNPMLTAMPSSTSEGASASKRLLLPPALRQRRSSSTTSRSPMQRITRRLIPCKPTIWACGSIRRQTRKRPGAWPQ